MLVSCEQATHFAPSTESKSFSPSELGLTLPMEARSIYLLTISSKYFGAVVGSLELSDIKTDVCVFNFPSPPKLNSCCTDACDLCNPTNGGPSSCGPGACTADLCDTATPVSGCYCDGKHGRNACPRSGPWARSAPNNALPEAASIPLFILYRTIYTYSCMYACVCVCVFG